jgi:hypothetical protein
MNPIQTLQSYFLKTPLLLLLLLLYFFRHYKKTKSAMHSFFRKLIKVTIKSDRERWLKSVDDNLISQPKQFWKYVYNFRRKDNTFTQIKVDDHFVIDPKNIADAFVNHFKSIFNTSCPTITASQPVTTDFLPTAPISAAEVSKRLKPSKCVGLDGIPSFIIKVALIFLFRCPHTYLILVYLVRRFHSCGKRLLLYQFSRKAAVLWSATTDLYLYLTIFLKYLNLLFMTAYIAFLNTDLILLSMASVNIIPP